jgi:biotin carboxylase
LLVKAKAINTIISIIVIGDIMKITTIAIGMETKEMIKNLAVKGETYDDIIRKMSAVYEEFLNRQYKKLGEKQKFKKMVL